MSRKKGIGNEPFYLVIRHYISVKTVYMLADHAPFFVLHKYKIFNLHTR